MDIEQLRRRVRLRDLETLAVVLKAGGIRKAAPLLHLSQPAVSKAISELEAALGVPLLARGPRGVQPTAFGLALARRADALTDGLRGALREIAELADPEGGEVRLGSMETLMAGVVGATAQDLLGTHPRLRLVFESGQSPDLIGHFLRGRLVDFVVARPWVHELPSDIEAEPLFHDRLFVVCGREHALARRRKLGLGELLDQRWVLSRNEAQPDSPVGRALRDAGLGLPARTVLSGSLPLRFTLLAQSGFLTCLPHSLLPFLHNRAALQLLPVRLPPWQLPTMVMTLRERVLSPAAELFLARLRQRAQQVADDPLAL